MKNHFKIENPPWGAVLVGSVVSLISGKFNDKLYPAFIYDVRYFGF
jgi:hypothetical protein